MAPLFSEIIITLLLAKQAHYVVPPCMDLMPRRRAEELFRAPGQQNQNPILPEPRMSPRVRCGFTRRAKETSSGGPGGRPSHLIIHQYLSRDIFAANDILMYRCCFGFAFFAQTAAPPTRSANAETHSFCVHQTQASEKSQVWILLSPGSSHVLPRVNVQPASTCCSFGGCSASSPFC